MPRFSWLLSGKLFSHGHTVENLPLYIFTLSLICIMIGSFPNIYLLMHFCLTQNSTYRLQTKYIRFFSCQTNLLPFFKIIVLVTALSNNLLLLSKNLNATKNYLNTSSNLSDLIHDYCIIVFDLNSYCQWNILIIL